MRIDPPADSPRVLSDHDVSHDIMTAGEVSQRLRLPLRTVYDLADAGQIPHFKLGRRRQFLRAEIEKIIARGRTEAAAITDL